MNEAPTSPAAPVKSSTLAGNYFISNYPPFSFWTEDQKFEVEQALDTPPTPGAKLGLYHHIPFCRKRCHFCYFRVYTDKNAQDIQTYLDATVTELKSLAERPLFRGRKPHFVYFGGGTPSYLSAKQLHELTDKLKAVLPWDAAEEVAFEAEPGTLNPGKLTAIKDVGVTRLSLGVEHFDDHVLEINGRAHRSAEVFTAYERARAENFAQINIDLIAGMLEETEALWQRNIEQLLALRPDSVTIYQMEVPYNTTIYKEMKADGKLVAPVADWQTKRRWVKEAFAALESAGYTIASGYTAVLDPQRTKFVYRDELWTGADLIGLGVASFSHAAGVHYQNVTEIEPYLAAINAGERPVKRAFRTSREELMIREFILQMKLGRVALGYFSEKFGVALAQRFAAQFGHLAAEGFLTVDATHVRLTRDGLLCVDTLLHEFFLSKHRTNKIV